MKKLELVCEGKKKRLYLTDDDQVLLMEHKDDLTAYDGLKRGTAQGKGKSNNRITAVLMETLEQNGIETAFLQEATQNSMLVRRVRMIPLEVIVRNIAAGSLCKRIGLQEGTALRSAIVEFCYKDNELGDPMVNEYHIAVMGWTDPATLDRISEIALKANQVLSHRFAQCGIELVDFKLEFGITDDGHLLVADEITPDTCRLWDARTGEPMDNDLFRRDLGGLAEAYDEISRRLLCDESEEDSTDEK